MGLTKADLFTEYQNELASFAKVFAHPARIAIVQHLIAANKCINSDLVEELGLAQATISQHLRELKDAGIICGSVSGVSMNYCINESNWNTIQQLFEQFFNTYHTNKCNC